MARFKTKTVVITGAGSGLGRSLAVGYARRGFKIGIVDINDAGAQETLKLVEQAGGQGNVFHADVTDPEAVKGMAAHFFSLWKGEGVGLLVNNAGIAVGGAVGDVPLDDWKAIVDVNFWGMLYGCHEFIPRMKAQGGGHIMNIASAAGILSLTNMGPYNVGKAAIISLSETLRVEVAPDNIGITVACPMFFNTRLLDNMKTTTPWIGEVAAISFKNGLSSDTVAERLISAVEKGKLYVIPMLVGKLFWLNKRLTPGLYYFLEALLHKHGLLKPLFYKLAHWGALSH
jgi:NAD(P)-dependent dehydrogenase (short-subunit alcohol dehydrogenase family)